MNLNKFAREVHANACAHGWWDEERDTAEIIALIHSEWSEALEEYRAGRPLVWHACGEQPNGNGGICNPQDEYDCTNYGRESECRYRGKKPEGIAVELIDGCIRILDFAAHEKIALKFMEIEPLHRALPTLIAVLHYYTSHILDNVGENGEINTHDHMPELLGESVYNVFRYIRAQGLDPEKIMLEKHEYNKTRPYRHGGKKC